MSPKDRPRPPKTLLRAPKMRPRGSQNPSKSRQEAPKRPSRDAQELPKISQEPLRTPQMPPRASKEYPRRFPEPSGVDFKASEDYFGASGKPFWPELLVNGFLVRGSWIADLESWIVKMARRNGRSPNEYLISNI